jgi:hypothetical protein
MAGNDSLALETASGVTIGSEPRATHRGNSDRRILSTASTSKTLGHRVFSAALLLIWLGIAGAALVWGMEYYATPLQERPFSDLHDLFKPSGLVGQGLGIIGTLMMFVGVGMYSLRKRLRILAGMGRLATWLQIHIFLCTLGPVLVLYHTSFKFGGIISVAFWSMVIVVVSGVFGRYLYGHIPKTIHGRFRSLESLNEQKEALVAAISHDFGLQPPDVQQLFPTVRHSKPKGFLHALALAIRYDFSKRKQRRRIRRLLAAAPRSDRGTVRRNSDEMPLYLRDSVVGVVQTQLQLQQQMVLLQPFQRLFRYWHLLHLPLAGVMLLILLLHVAVAVAFGYTWVF